MEGKSSDLIRRGLVLYWVDRKNKINDLRQEIENIPAAPREMTAREYVKQRTRMCRAYYDIDRSREGEDGCTKCPLFEYCEGANDELDVVNIVERWAKEHPEPKPADKPITYADIFFAIHQNAPGREDADGSPRVCRGLIFGTPCEAENYDCKKCWNEPYPEPID